MPRSRKSRYADDYRTLLGMLCERRVAAGVTQVELAKRMGTSQSMLSKLERGVVRMDLTDMLDHLAGTGTHPVGFLTDYLERTGWQKTAGSGRSRARKAMS